MATNSTLNLQSLALGAFCGPICDGPWSFLTCCNPISSMQVPHIMSEGEVNVLLYVTILFIVISHLSFIYLVDFFKANVTLQDYGHRFRVAI